MAETNFTPTKACTKCGESKPLAEFSNSSSKKCKDGKFSWCKACARAGNKEWRERNSERISAERRAKYSANPEPVREYMRNRYIKDPSARCDAIAEWRKANPEKQREMNRNWYVSNAAKAKAAAKAYREANSEACKVISRRRSKEHYEKNKDKYYLRSATRRAMKSGSRGTLSAGIRKRLFLDQKGLCVYCRIELGDSPHLDHKVPLVKGGTHTDDNVQLLCQQCNLSKGAKMPDEFLKYIESRAR